MPEQLQQKQVAEAAVRCGRVRQAIADWCCEGCSRVSATQLTHLVLPGFRSWVQVDVLLNGLQFIRKVPS